ncbi:hypothetical protein CSKR_102768, partial [Clonorchis sinensis]
WNVISAYTSPTEVPWAEIRAIRPLSMGARWRKWLEPEFTDRKVHGSNPTSASRLPLSRLGQPGSIPALLLPSGGMAARHQKGATAERLLLLSMPNIQYGLFPRPTQPHAEMAQWLEREFSDRKVPGSNPTSIFRLPCLGFDNLEVFQPSCFLLVAWQLGTERVLQKNITNERFSWVPGEFHPFETKLLGRQLNVLHQAASCFGCYDIRDIAIHQLKHKAAWCSTFCCLETSQTRDSARLSVSQNQIDLQMRVFIEISPIWVQAHFPSFRQPYILLETKLRENSEIHSLANKFGFSGDLPGTQLNLSFQRFQATERAAPASGRVRVYGELSESFRTQSGVRQGRPLSPFLFNFLVDEVMRQTQESLKNSRVQIACDENPVDLEYADDIVLIFEEKAYVFFDEPTKAISSFGMHFAPTNCKNPAESLVCDVSRPLNVLHQAASCFSRSDIPDILIHARDSAGFQNIRLTETRGLRLPDEPQEGRNRSWAVKEFSATL